MMTPPHWLSAPRAAAPACPACAYPPSTLADELGSPVVLTPSAREVAIDFKRATRTEVRVLHMQRR